MDILDESEAKFAVLWGEAQSCAYRRLFPNSKAFTIDQNQALFGGSTHGFLEYEGGREESGVLKRIVFLVMHPDGFLRGQQSWVPQTPAIMKFICAATGKLDFEKTSSQGSFVARASLRVQISEMWDPSYRIDWDHLLHVDCMAWECPGHFEGLTLNQQWRRVVDVVSLMKRTEDYGFNQIKWTEISSQIIQYLDENSPVFGGINRPGDSTISSKLQTVSNKILAMLESIRPIMHAGGPKNHADGSRQGRMTMNDFHTRRMRFWHGWRPQLVRSWIQVVVGDRPRIPSDVFILY